MRGSMLRLRNFMLRRVNGEYILFKMNSGMEDTSQIFVCKNGSRRRPMSARDGNLTNIDYETEVLNMVDDIVQGSQRKGIKHAAMVQQPTFMQHRSRSWTAADKAPSDNRGGRIKEIRSFEGIAYTKLCITAPVKCICGRVDRAPPSFLASQRTSISPKKRRDWGNVPSSLRERSMGIQGVSHRPRCRKAPVLIVDPSRLKCKAPPPRGCTLHEIQCCAFQLLNVRCALHLLRHIRLCSRISLLRRPCAPARVQGLSLQQDVLLQDLVLGGRPMAIFHSQSITKLILLPGSSRVRRCLNGLFIRDLCTSKKLLLREVSFQRNF